MRNPALIGFYTMVRKDLIRILRIWSQTLLPPIITMALYFTIFGTFIGSQLKPINGHTYIEFIVPGLVMMTIITSAYMNTVSTFYFAKFIKNIEELLVSPMPAWVIVAGFVTGGVVRSFLVGTLVIITSLFFTHLVVSNVFVIFAAALLTSFLFSFAGI